MAISVGLGGYSDWPSVQDKAAATGVDQSTLAIQPDGTIVGIDETTGALVVLGVWTGGTMLGSAGGASTVTGGAALPPPPNTARLPGLLGLAPNLGPNLLSGNFGNVPWWLWALLIGSAVIILRSD